MSLRVKIREQAKTPKDIARYMSLCLGDAITIAENEQWVSVGVVSDLLDEATKQINQIMCEDYWTCNVHLNKVREKILGVLSGEKKVEG